MSNQKPSGTSNATIGIQTYEVKGPLRTPASCRGRPTTRRSEATTPIQARGTGTVRPRRRRYEKRVLPMANKIALIFQSGPLRSYVPSACRIAASGAFGPADVPSHSSSSVARVEMAPSKPSPTRKIRASIARSESWSRVIAYSVTARTIAHTAWSRPSAIVRRTWRTCWAILASFAVTPSPLVAWLNRACWRCRPRCKREK